MTAIFPPEKQASQWNSAVKEVTLRPNPPRRLRSYPRVVKRKTVGTKLTKRREHRQTTYGQPPTVQIVTRPAA